jgi:uncharacterized caspase-like protein
MSARYSRWFPGCGAVAAVLWGGCADAPEQKTIAEAFTIESKDARIAEEIAAKDAEQRRIAAEERKKAEAALDSAVDAAAVQPAEPPADLEAACDAVVEAHDAYMKSGSERDALVWSDGRRRKMGERRVACIKVAKLPVAACEAQALRNAPPALDVLSREDAARRLMERCHDKFGSS